MLLSDKNAEAEEIQFSKALRTLEEFVKILVNEYPLVFKDGIWRSKGRLLNAEPTLSLRSLLEIQIRKHEN